MSVNDNEWKYASFIQKKMTVLLENTTSKQEQRKRVFHHCQTLNNSTVVLRLGKNQPMIPFLTVRENLLLGISRKKQQEALLMIETSLSLFNLTSSVLSLKAQRVSLTDQIILQLLRAITLEHNLLIFDYDMPQSKSESRFLLELMPILKKFNVLQGSTITIVTQNEDILNSKYYDFCILLDNINAVTI